MVRQRADLWILCGALLSYGAMTAVFGLLSHAANDRHLVYALDDAYIHMAIARNTAQYAIFGVTPYEFSASSSSPLWTALLSGMFYVLGPAEWLPFALNGLGSVATVCVLWWFARAADISGFRLGLLLMGCILLVPILPLAFTGMEHVLHVAASLLLLYSVWLALERDDRAAAPFWLLAAASALATALRYESLFLVAGSVLALSVRRRWAAAVVCGATALLPVVVFGGILIANGQHFLPNTLLLKGHVPDASSLGGIVRLMGGGAARKLLAAPHLYALAICLVTVWWRQRAAGCPLGAAALLPLVVLAATGLHLQFAETGGFYRYEAYLVALALITLSVQLRALEARGARYPARRRFAPAPLAGVVVLLLLPLVMRAVPAHRDTIQATRNIYRQQYQMGRFLHRFYDGEAVAANDIGAINYHARLRCLDLWGLASRDVMEFKRGRVYSTSEIREIAAARRVRIAVVFMSWFRGRTALPPEWTVVGDWTIRDNVVAGDETVSFLATTPEEAEVLLRHLREFSAELPDGVIARFRPGDDP